MPAASDNSEGWFYHLLTQAGATPSTARSVNDFVVRPLEVVLVVAVAALVAHFGARAIRRVLGRMATQAAARTEGRPAPRVSTLVTLISNVWRLFVAIVAIAIVLGMLGVNLTPLLASATIIGATLGFGAQSLVRDYLSGILLAMEDQFGIGDTIAVGATTGVVEDVSLRVTRMRAMDGSVCYVPNGEIRQLTNSSRGWAKAMVDVPVSPGDTAAFERVREVVAEAALEVAHSPRFAPTCTEPPEVLGIVDADSATCTVRVALRTTPARRVSLERALREEMVARLADQGLWPAGGAPTADGS
jgi:small conductance mechanosensitive channel